MTIVAFIDTWCHNVRGLGWVPRAFGLRWLVNRELDEIERVS